MGPLEVYNGDERVQEGDWKTQKVKYLFARLAVNRGLPVPEDQLIESFWPDDVEKGKRNLYWSTSVLRKILRSPDSVDPVIRKGGNLSLNPDIPRWHDYEELDDLVSGQPSEPERFRRVLELYRGPYLEGCYLDWAVEIRNRLEKQVGDILAGLADWAHQREQHQECLEFARRLLEVDPYRQEAHLWVMQSCLALGRPEEAVRQFNSCSKVLKRDLGMEPSIKLLEFHQRALLSLSQ